MSFQKIAVLGHLGKNVEVKTIGQKEYLALTLAVSNGKDAQGNERESDWFDVLYSYNKQTQSWLLALLQKGNVAYVEGRVRVNAWIDKEGKPQGGLSIFANKLEPIGKLEPRQNTGSYTQPVSAPQPPVQPQVAPPVFDDTSATDLPF